MLKLNLNTLLFQSIALSSNEGCFGAETASNEKAKGKKRKEKVGENKKIQTKANFENTWEMEAELGVETFLFVSVRAEEAKKLFLVPFFHWPQLSFFPVI